MAEMLHDAFEAWIRERARGCLTDEEINMACEGILDFESGVYEFYDTVVQAQWEAWQEAKRLYDRSST